tara:strand:- start:261 stop:458 length:198 start_codon:yes stop_codon:yes gene_type:complete
MNVKLEKIIKGYYIDKISNRDIELKNKIWQVKNQCDGQVYFSGKTLKECKVYQSQENDIRAWSDY